MTDFEGTLMEKLKDRSAGIDPEEKEALQETVGLVTTEHELNDDEASMQEANDADNDACTYQQEFTYLILRV
jgi:hypothetical protein